MSNEFCLEEQLRGGYLESLVGKKVGARAQNTSGNMTLSCPSCTRVCTIHQMITDKIVSTDVVSTSGTCPNGY